MLLNPRNPVGGGLKDLTPIFEWAKFITFKFQEFSFQTLFKLLGKLICTIVEKKGKTLELKFFLATCF
jgi:hypothetical protein